MNELFTKIEAAGGFHESSVDVPEWEMTVKLREPTSGEVAAARKKFITLNPDGTAHLGKSNTDMLSYAMLSLCIVDEDNERCFKDAQQAHDILSKKSPRIVGRLIKEAGKLCGEDPEDAEKN